MPTRIKGTQIKDESITGTQINDDTLTGDDINESTLKVTFITDLDGDTKIHVEESADEDKIRFYVAGSEEVTIDSNGRLGINTSDPNYKLDVSGNMGLNEFIYHNGDEDTYIRFQNNQLDLVAGGQIASFGSNILNIAGSIVPSSDVTYNLGSTSNVWNNIYGNNGTLNDLTVLNNLTLSGSDISFQDNAGTFPTDSGSFFWDLNDDETEYMPFNQAVIILIFISKLVTTLTILGRFIFWNHHYNSLAEHHFPLVMYGHEVFIHSPPSGTEGVPDTNNAKITIPVGTSSDTTTTHKGRLFLDGDNTNDLYIRFQNNAECIHIPRSIGFQ